jgi:hypothetical protein
MRAAGAGLPRIRTPCRSPALRRTNYTLLRQPVRLARPFRTPPAVAGRARRPAVGVRGPHQPFDVERRHHLGGEGGQVIRALKTSTADANLVLMGTYLGGYLSQPRRGSYLVFPGQSSALQSFREILDHTHWSRCPLRFTRGVTPAEGATGGGGRADAFYPVITLAFFRATDFSGVMY